MRKFVLPILATLAIVGCGRIDQKVGTPGNPTETSVQTDEAQPDSLETQEAETQGTSP